MPNINDPIVRHRAAECVVVMVVGRGESGPRIRSAVVEAAFQQAQGAAAA